MRRAAVGRGGAAAPLAEYLAAIVQVDGDLDQARPVMSQCPVSVHYTVRLAHLRGTQAEPLAVPAFNERLGSRTMEETSCTHLVP